MATSAISKPAGLAPRSTTSLSSAVSPTKQVSRTPSRSRAEAAPGITPSVSASSTSSKDKAWGSNFWVTLVDPQSGVSFYACPGTGEVSWDPPTGNFVLPPSVEGEWWELADESRGGLPYYYHTKTHETVWDRPDGFVIPLGILQKSAAGKRLSWSLLNGGTVSNGYMGDISSTSAKTAATPSSSNTPSRSKSHTRTGSGQSAHSGSSHSSPRTTPSKPAKRAPAPSYPRGHTLSTIPGSPDVTEASGDEKPANQYTVDEHGRLELVAPGPVTPGAPISSSSRPRSRSYTSLPRMSTSNSQSLAAAVEVVVATTSSSPPSPASSRRSFGFRSRKSISSPDVTRRRGRSATTSEPEPPPMPETPTKKNKGRLPGVGSVPALPDALRSWKSKNGSSVAVNISAPVLDHEATANMSPIKMKGKGQPIPIGNSTSANLSGSSNDAPAASTRPILPKDLVSDIQQFIEDDYAKQYFSTHKAGFIFRRKIPLAQMMTWQKAPLSHPLLLLNRSLHKDAVKIFRIIQRVMGDRESERPSASRAPSSTQSLPARSYHQDGSSALLEEERWVLGEGISHGELRDEIYCQVMKQLNGNPNQESSFKGWQFLCVLLVTFPPSKNFETSLRAFIQQHTTHSEGRIDVIAKHCMKKLEYVSKKGPRGKPPTLAEIESASDAAFNPSIFGESLDAVLRLQERSYPKAQVPIILPFLTDGILALGGARAEGIFRVPGDGDTVSALRVRVDRGQYSLGDIDDPHVPASLLKLWLRELRAPLVPGEMYDDCVRSAKDPTACIELVRRLPTIHRRVVLFLISFLQIFLDERTQEVTKMTPVNLALVMAPNLLRCESDSMAVVFTNAQFEQIFVHNLLLHLKPDQIDPDYKPTHGMGVRGVVRNT